MLVFNYNDLPIISIWNSQKSRGTWWLWKLYSETILCWQVSYKSKSSSWW